MYYVYFEKVITTLSCIRYCPTPLEIYFHPINYLGPTKPRGFEEKDLKGTLDRFMRQNLTIMARNLKRTYTVTFGDVAENHARMQKVGKLADNGYPCSKLEQLALKLKSTCDLECEIVQLDRFWKGDEDEKVGEASVLVIRRGVQHILGDVDTSSLMAEHDGLTMDKHALMRGKVVNKHARWNLCFAEEDQDPVYQDGKGRIVAYRRVPLTSCIREKVSEWLEDDKLNGEANYYYDISKCGIGYHGEAERRKVVAMRMGESMPLYFQWFQRSKPVGDRVKIELHDGDMYVMSEAAVGFDWLKKIKPTLRHSTGCDKYTVFKVLK